MTRLEFYYLETHFWELSQSYHFIKKNIIYKSNKQYISKRVQRKCRLCILSYNISVDGIKATNVGNGFMEEISKPFPIQ